MKNNLIKIENLSVNFGTDGPQALKNFSLCVHPMDKIAIIGETGSGKSVMLQAILGLLPHSANISGEIFYDKENLLQIERNRWNQIRGNEISYVPQGSGNSMNPLLSIGYQVGEPLLIHKKENKKNVLQKAVELLKLFNIGDEENRAKHYPHTFSGGMKQRALIAMGISAGAQIILADEPTKGLDSKRIEMVKNCFTLLQDKTYICVTHDLNFAKDISNILCIMYSSELIEVGNTQEVFENPYHPYTQDIINAMPEKGLKYHGDSMFKELVTDGCGYIGKCQYASEQCKSTPPMVEMENNRKVRCWKYAASK